MAQALGSDIVAFFDSEWPDELFVDDGTMSIVDGKIVKNDDSAESALALSSKYDLDDFGCLCSTSGEAPFSLTTFFNRWKKEQTTETLIIEIPKGERPTALLLLAGHGYKVVNK